MNTPSQHAKRIGILIVLVLFVTACGGTNAAPPISDADTVASLVASTLQAVQAQATPTLAATATPIPASPIPPTLPPTLPPATFTLTPLPTLPPATHVQFQTGATLAIITGQIQPGQTLNYMVQAAKGQPLIALLDSPNHDTKLSIVGADGTALLSAASGLSNWEGLLPATQDYYIQVTGGAATQNFSLNVTIVARVQFGAGETRVVVKGSTVGGYAVSYVAYAAKGQKMDVILNVPGDKAALTVWGFEDGIPYARAQTGTKDVSLDLPATQDYIIEVVPQAGQVVEYSMTIRIK